MREYNDTSYQESTSAADYTSESPLTYDQTQFDFAIAIQSVDNEPQFYDDLASYLTLSVSNFFMRTENGATSVKNIEIPLRRCTVEDIESRFRSYSPE